jgi:two-component system, OmpR family, sensor histidine kinase KdpD
MLNVNHLRRQRSALNATLQKTAVGYVMAVLGITAMTALLHPARAQINATTVALIFLLDMLFVAILWGSGPALLASVLGMVCFNFFFLPLVGALTIADPQNWVALTVFFITAIAVGQLSARAKRRPAGARLNGFIMNSKTPLSGRATPRRSGRARS